MKKSLVIIFALVSGLYLASCNKENILADDSAATALSAARASGADTTGSDSTRHHKGHHPKPDSTKTHFHPDSLKKHIHPDSTKAHSRPDSAKGPKLTKVEISALPAAITSYITATYAGYEIKQAAKSEEGLYYVGIASTDAHKLIVFNADGTFKEEKSAPKGGPGKPKKGK
ncbi:hypothetical protein [Runella sp.]|uniref:hypothetical protein n=1 Tax=Runella sp. TaxID=1960881 RepID=UPI003D0C22A0